MKARKDERNGKGSKDWMNDCEENDRSNGETLFGVNEGHDFDKTIVHSIGYIHDHPLDVNLGRMTCDFPKSC